MTSYKIEKLEDLLKGHFTGTIVKQSVTRLTAPGENYGSLMLKVDVTVKNNNKEETLYTVAKCVPTNKDIQFIFSTSVTFKNEIGWYQCAIPALQEFELKESGQRSLDFFQKVYGARFNLNPDSEEVDENGVILSENLAIQGFKNASRFVGFNLEQTRQVIKKLAAFHAFPLALKLKHPEVFDDKVKKYLHKLQNDHPGPTIDPYLPIIALYKTLPETVALSAKIEEKLKQHFSGNPLETIVREPWGTALHNDFWVNNIMIKNLENAPPLVKILDLQTCDYGSPVKDLLFLLGTSVQDTVANEYFDEFINLYYSEFTRILNSVNVDLAHFSYKRFQEELDIEGPKEFIHCLFFILIILSDNKNAGDTNSAEFDLKEEMEKMVSNINDRHKEKFIFLAQQFEKRNWI